MKNWKRSDRGNEGKSKHEKFNRKREGKVKLFGDSFEGLRAVEMVGMCLMKMEKRDFIQMSQFMYLFLCLFTFFHEQSCFAEAPAQVEQ